MIFRSRKAESLGVEEELRGVLCSGLPDLLGRIDLLLETDDAVVVQDFKTSRSAWSEQQAEDQSEQLLLYADLARSLIPGKKLRLQFAVVTKGKTPKCQSLEARVRPNQAGPNKADLFPRLVSDSVRSFLSQPLPNAMPRLRLSQSMYSVARLNILDLSREKASTIVAAFS